MRRSEFRLYKVPARRDGRGAEVRDADIEGYAPGATEAIVRWWHVIPDGGGFRVEKLHEVVVAL